MVSVLFAWERKLTVWCLCVCVSEGNQNVWGCEGYAWNSVVYTSPSWPSRTCLCTTYKRHMHILSHNMLPVDTLSVSLNRLSTLMYTQSYHKHLLHYLSPTLITTGNVHTNTHAHHLNTHTIYSKYNHFIFLSAYYIRKIKEQWTIKVLIMCATNKWVPMPGFPMCHST